MSSLIIEIAKIENVEKHPNADRLDLVFVKGWCCIVSKDSFKKNDKCVYIPIDSILPPEIEDKIFGSNSKIKPEKTGRIRTIKLRGFISQGLVVSLDTLGLSSDLLIGTDVASELKITKYEPEEKPKFGQNLPQSSKKQINPHFHKYTDIENIKNFPDVFIEGEEVYVSEKIHGTSFRCGWFPTSVNTIWKKIKKYLGLLPKYEFCYGSRNVQLQERKSPEKTLYYGSNVYLKIVEQYHLKTMLKFGEAIYGEIVGDGIQAGYTYGCGTNEHKLFVYDIMIEGQYVNWEDFELLCEYKKLSPVPTIDIGPYDYSSIKKMTSGPSLVISSQEIREGVVIKPIKEGNHPRIGRKVLKFINDEYLLNKTNTDFH